MAHQYSRVGFKLSVEVNEVNSSLSYGGVDQYLHFDSHHPVSHKFSIIIILNHKAQTALTDLGEMAKELDHIKGALKSLCLLPVGFCFYLANSQSNTSDDKNIRPQSDHLGSSKKNTTFSTLPRPVCRRFITGTTKSVQVLRCWYFF